MPENLETKPLGAWREERLLTLQELGELVGVKFQTIWNWENGRAKPTYKNWRALARALDVQPRQITFRPIPKLTAA